MVAAEAAPFAKTGGLADVVGSLPKALAARGHDVRVVMPAYADIERAAQSGRWGLKRGAGVLRVPVGGGFVDAGVFETTLPGSSVPISFIAERYLFDRPQIYGYGDDPYRFAFFSRAALDLVVAAEGWRPDVVHAHDWHAAPAIAWLATAGRLDPRYRGLPTVFTIHNLLHQGKGPREVLGYLGIDASPLVEEGPSSTNFMARAIYHATMINTVSPTYAREILTPEYRRRPRRAPALPPLRRARDPERSGLRGVESRHRLAPRGGLRGELDRQPCGEQARAPGTARPGADRRAAGGGAVRREGLVEHGGLRVL